MDFVLRLEVLLESFEVEVVLWVFNSPVSNTY